LPQPFLKSQMNSVLCLMLAGMQAPTWSLVVPRSLSLAGCIPSIRPRWSIL
jgi:hypothetical protein